MRPLRRYRAHESSVHCVMRRLRHTRLCLQWGHPCRREVSQLQTKQLVLGIATGLTSLGEGAVGNGDPCPHWGHGLLPISLNTVWIRDGSFPVDARANLRRYGGVQRIIGRPSVSLQMRSLRALHKVNLLDRRQQTDRMRHVAVDLQPRPHRTNRKPPNLFAQPTKSADG